MTDVLAASEARRSCVTDVRMRRHHPRRRTGFLSVFDPGSRTQSALPCSSRWFQPVRPAWTHPLDERRV